MNASLGQAVDRMRLLQGAPTSPAPRQRAAGPPADLRKLQAEVKRLRTAFEAPTPHLGSTFGT